MRFDDLFEDMSHELLAGQWQEMRAEAGELARAEYARRDFLTEVAGAQVKVHVTGHSFTGKVVAVGSGWFGIESARESWLFPDQAGVWVEVLGSAAGVGSVPRTEAQSRNTAQFRNAAQCRSTKAPWKSALRAVGRDRQSVRFVLSDGVVGSGLIVAVGGDFVRMQAQVGGSASRSLVLVPLGALAAVSAVSTT